jgi:hypothetical protein
MMETTRPRAPSNKSEKSYHQQEMKQQARQLYRRNHPTDPNKIKCMILDEYFDSKDVTLSHIVAVGNKQLLSVLNYEPRDIWNPRNGLLVWREFEPLFENL